MGFLFKNLKYLAYIWGQKLPVRAKDLLLFCHAASQFSSLRDTFLCYFTILDPAGISFVPHVLSEADLSVYSTFTWVKLSI